MSSTQLLNKYVTSDFDRMIEILMEEWKVPGISLAIVQDDEIYAKGYGFTRPKGAPVTAESLFDCASMSKSFTSAAVALLVDDDAQYPEVKFETPMSELLREDFVLNDPILTKQVTIIDILSHRTGILEHEYSTFGRLAKQPDDAKSITRNLRHFPATLPFRTKYQYNNFMFTAASHLVETLAKQPYADFLKEHFWKPLGMDNTHHGRWDMANWDESKIAQPMCCNEKTSEYVEIPYMWGHDGQGAGEIISSAADWAKWIRAMIQDNTGISKESVQELLKPRILSDTEPEDDDRLGQSAIWYGMGWCIEYYRGYRVVSHAGNIAGMVSYMVFLPKLKFGYVMFGNSERFSSVLEVISHRLIDDRLNVPESDRGNWIEHERKEYQKTKDEEKESEEKLFADRADPPVPMLLPLEKYAGRYQRPGYGEFEVQIKDEQLFIDASTRTYAFVLKFDHVSASFFIANRVRVPDVGETAKYEAEFCVGVSNRVEEMGIDFMTEDEDDYVWFRRI